MKIPDLSIIEKTLNNEATSEESCEVVRWFKTPEGQAWLAERIDQDEKTIHMGEEEAWIDHPIPSAVMYQNIMRQLRRLPILRIESKDKCIRILCGNSADKKYAVL